MFQNIGINKVNDFVRGQEYQKVNIYKRHNS